jgi:hypothetical protein
MCEEMHPYGDNVCPKCSSFDYKYIKGYLDSKSPKGYWKRTTVINLFGSSGCGKSMLQAQLFHHFKDSGIDAMMTQEYVKKWAILERCPDFLDQFYILGNESQQQKTLFGKVDYVISDSPLYFIPFYTQYLYNSDILLQPTAEFYKIAEEQFGVKFVNFFLERDREYENVGRYQTAEESDKLSTSMKLWLDNNSIEYTNVGLSRLEQVLDNLNI